MKNTIWKKYKEKTVLKKMFTLTSGISSVFLIIIGIVVGSQMVEVKRHEIIQTDQKTMQNMQLIIDKYMETANNTVQILYKNPYIKRALVKEGTEWDDTMFISGQSIVTSISVNTQLHSIYLVGMDGIVMKCTGPSYPMTDEMDEQVFRVFKNSYVRNSNIWSYSDIYGRNHDMYSIVLGEMDAHNNSYLRGIIVNLDMGSLINQIFPGVKDKESYLLADEKGILIGLKSGVWKFGEDVGSDEIFRAVTGAEGKSGFLSLNWQGEKTLVNYTYSNNNGYYLIHVLPYSVFEGKLMSTVYWMVCMTVILVLLALALSMLGTIRVYRPINEFITYIKNPSESLPGVLTEENEFTSISRDFVKLKTQLQYYDGKSNEARVLEFFRSRHQNPLLPEIFEEENRSFCVCVLRIADLEGAQEGRTEDEMIFHAESFCNIMLQAYQLAGEVSTYIMDYEYLISILFLNDTAQVSAQSGLPDRQSVENEGYTRIKEASQSILKIGQSVLMLRADIGVSGIYRNAAELKEAYQMAKAATKYRFLFGSYAVITELQMKECALHGEATGYNLEQVMETVRKRERGVFEEKLEQISTYIREHSLQTGYEILITLAIEMMKYQKEVTHNKEKVMSYEAVREKLDSFVYISQVTVWYFELFDDISMTTEFIQNIGGRDIVQAAEKYIRTYYMDINLNAQFLANKYNITPSYFSRIFKEHTDSAFPDYLAGIRLEEAKRLLMQDTGKSVQEICEQAGYTNPSYFITLFKKKYGLTPSKYRMGNRIDQEAAEIGEAEQRNEAKE